MTEQVPAWAALSPDGAWIWNGAGWVPNPTYTPVAPFRATRVSSTLAILGLILAAGGAVFMMGAVLHRYAFAGSLIDGTAAADAVAEADRADTLVLSAVAAYIALYVLAGIAFLVWTHAVVRNNPALGGRELAFRPAAAVGWWFAPFANLVMPFRALGETWKVSEPVSGPIDARRRAAVPLGRVFLMWWIGYALAGVLGLMLRFTARTDPTLEELRSHDAVFAAAGAVLAVAAFLGAAMVHALTGRQEAKAAALSRGTLTV